MRTYFVYYLCAPDDEDHILYIGRSHDPEERRKEHQRVFGQQFVIRNVDEYLTFEEACAKEVEAIEKYWPPLNKVARSSPGKSGKKHTPAQTEVARRAQLGKRHSQQTRELMSNQRKGRKFTEEHKRAMSLAHTGKVGHKHTEATRMLISTLQKGRAVSQETRAKISAAKRARRAP